CAVVTVWLDRRSAAPLIPGSLRRNAAVRAAGLWAAMINFALVTVLFSLPLLLPRNALALGGDVVADDDLDRGESPAHRPAGRPARATAADPAGLRRVPGRRGG